jgi:hypothetical protein
VIVYEVVFPLFHVVFPGPVKIAPPLARVVHDAFLTTNFERNAPDPPVFADGVQADSVPLIVTVWFAAFAPRPGTNAIVPFTVLQVCTVTAPAGAAAIPTIPAANAIPNVMLANRRYTTPSSGLLPMLGNRYPHTARGKRLCPARRSERE